MRKTPKKPKSYFFLWKHKKMHKTHYNKIKHIKNIKLIFPRKIILKTVIKRNGESCLHGLLHLGLLVERHGDRGLEHEQFGHLFAGELSVVHGVHELQRALLLLLV